MPTKFFHKALNLLFILFPKVVLNGRQLLHTYVHVSLGSLLLVQGHGFLYTTVQYCPFYACDSIRVQCSASKTLEVFWLLKKVRGVKLVNEFLTYMYMHVVC